MAAALPERPGPEVSVHTPACALWEPPADCDDCGACCREAFDAVPVEHDEEAARIDPSWLVVESDGWRRLARSPSPLGCGSRCAALRGDGAPDRPFRCVIYEVRPEPCRELEAGTEPCLHARRRVGRSPWPPGAIPDGPLAQHR